MDLFGLVCAAEALTGRGRACDALALYEAWLRHHPEDPGRYAACFNYGVLLSQAGQPARALAAFSETIARAPGFDPAYINAGLSLERLGRPELAAGYWLDVADRAAPLASAAGEIATAALKHLSRVLKAAGDVRSAEEALRRCLAIDPHQRDAVQHWIALRQMQCKWPVIEPSGRLTRQTLTQAISPLSLAVESDDPMLQLANAHIHYERDVVRPRAPHVAGRWVPPSCAGARDRRLRIGYVSPDLREHAVGYLTAELFELHDSASVEVFAYYTGRRGPDALQERIRRAVDRWCALAGWDDKQAAKRIVADEIDILIDLGGYTGDSPTGLLALRPAPVIVNWLGFPGSMGTPHHHYIVADDYIIQPALERFYSERVVRLPCYQPTDRRRAVAPLPLSREAAGLPSDAIVYCCFNGTQKITPGVFGRWMTILGRVPGAVLWLLSCDAETDARLRLQAASAGIAPERVVFAARKQNAEHLARYRLADLFLDTHPYGAHTTGSDALWMGLPVLTMPGNSFASRVCGSLVRAAGLPELICADPTTYVDTAVALGRDPSRLLALRARLDAGREKCVLFDMPLLVKRLEALYRDMWGAFLSGDVPDPDLTNLPLYAEIGRELAIGGAETSSLDAIEQRYKLALSYRDSISPLAPDCRFWSEARAHRRQ